MKKSLGPKTLLALTPVVLVGTYGPDGRPNLMTAAWCGVAGSKPPYLSVSLRAATLSHGNIKHNLAFTISPAVEGLVVQTDYLGLESGRDADKFAACGLTPARSAVVNAPYAAELPLVLECELFKVVELGLHTMFIGEIKDVKADEAVLDDRGDPDPRRVRPFAYVPEVREYFALGESLGKAHALGKPLLKR